jgi:4-amino-4-deoxy-L-arabinose transferase-like glycosyltransferase
MSPAPRLCQWLAALSERRRLLGVFLFALSLRLFYLAQIQDSPFFDTLLGDGAAYDAWAVQIGHDFWGKQAFFQAPLYPYFLSGIYGIFGRDLWLVRFVQMSLGSGACVLLASSARAFFSRRVGFWSGVALAIYGPALFFDGIVQKSSLDLFLTTLLLFWLSRLEKTSARRFPALAGATLGCLALTRENALIWAPCLLVWLALRVPKESRKVALRRSVAPFALGLSLVLAPVAMRNFAVSGQLFITTSQFGQNFYIGNNPHADGTYESLRFGHGGAELEQQDAKELAEAAAGHELSAAEVSRYWSGRAFRFIRQEPGAWLRLLGKKLLLVVNQRELADSDEPLVYEDASWLLRGLTWLFGFQTLFPLALVGALGKPRERFEPLILHVLWLSLAASTALFFAFARYRYPLVPVLMPFAVSGVFRAARALSRRQYAAIFRLGVTAAIGLLVVSLRLTPPGHPRAAAYYDLAVSLERLERPVDAKLNYQNALRANPELVEAHVNLGSLLARSGDLEEAATHERAALRLRPDDAVAHADLGNIFFEQNHFSAAATQYAEALRLDPSQPQAREGVAALREQLGRAHDD